MVFAILSHGMYRLTRFHLVLLASGFNCGQLNPVKCHPRPLNKYHSVLIHVHVLSAMTTKLAIILILRKATRRYTHQTHKNRYNIIIYKNTHINSFIAILMREPLLILYSINITIYKQ